MNIAGVCTGVGFSNFNSSQTGIRSRIKKFGTGAELESQKLTAATSGVKRNF